MPVRAASSTVGDGAPAQVTSDDPAGGLRSTIHYEEVVAHEDDVIDFTPGKRVTLGFTPRPGDAWKVGGASARALPAGRLDGNTMRREGPAPTKRERPAVSPAPSSAPDSTPSAAPTSSAAPSAEPTTSPGLVAPVDPVDEPPADPAPVEAVDAGWDDTSSGDGSTTDARVSSSGLRREVFGFLPYWELTDSSTTLDFRSSRRSPTSALVRTGTGTCRSATATAARRWAGVAGRARG